MPRAKAQTEDESTTTLTDAPDLFPELDDTSDEHKELMRRARKYAKEKVARDALLKENKEQVDGFMQKLAEQMHACELPKFKLDGVSYEISTGKEKVKIKIEIDDDDDEDESGESE